LLRAGEMLCTAMFTEGRIGVASCVQLELGVASCVQLELGPVWVRLGVRSRIESGPVSYELSYLLAKVVRRICISIGFIA
jgi:hypothetical protein